MKKYIIIIILTLLTGNIYSQVNSREVIMQAMKDEMKRNIEKLALEKLSQPFFISYTVGDAQFLTIRATLGSVTFSKENPKRDYNMRVMVGSYKTNDENYVDANFWGGDYIHGELPLENDYNGIRRAFWLNTDGLYKNAAETYERKQSAIKQQNRPIEEDTLSDYSKAPKVKLILPPKEIKFDRALSEKRAKDLSLLFKNHPEIYSSGVFLCQYSADIFYTSTEGTETIYPVSITGLLVNAYTQAEDGEPLFDHLIYYGLAPTDIPHDDAVKTDIGNMIKNLLTLRKAPSFNDSYSGPVLFEGQAAGEVFAQRLFASATGLVASRMPLFSDPSIIMYMSGGKQKSIEDKIGRKVISNDFTIKTSPFTSSFGGKPLIGKFDVDAEGVVPDKDMILVDKGILRTLLNDRVPTLKIHGSNGHSRLGACSPYSEKGPGVIIVNSSNISNDAKLKEKLLSSAKNEGLDYAIIIRKLIVPNPGIDMDMFRTENTSSSGEDKQTQVSKPVYIYKVYVKDGREELVRSAKTGGISMSALKRITGSSDRQMVYNTLINRGNYYGSTALNGIPTSLIMPQSLLFEELDVEKDKRAYTPKLPIVENPVSK